MYKVNQGAIKTCHTFMLINGHPPPPHPTDAFSETSSLPGVEVVAAATRFNMGNGSWQLNYFPAPVQNLYLVLKTF